MLRLPPLRLLTVFLCGLLSLPLAASELGRSLTRNFSHRDFAAPGQVTGATQTSDGRLYFSSQQTLLEFDGGTWSHHRIPSGFDLSVARDPHTDRLYVSAHDQVGYFERNDRAQLAYHSLLGHLPDQLKSFGASHGLIAHDDAIFFATQNHVLLWRDNRFTLLDLPPGRARSKLLSTSTDLFLHRPGVGLLRFNGSAFEPLVSDSVIRDANAVAIFQLHDSLIIGAGSSGLWRWQHDTLTRFVTAADALLQRTQISSGTLLPDGRFVIGTLDLGVIAISPDGESFNQFSLDQGVIDPAVRSVFLDRDAALWIGTDGGITRLDPNDGVTIFDRHNGLRQPIINGIWRHRGRLYVSTLDGLLRLTPANPQTGHAARFEKVESVLRNAREMASHSTGLLIGTPSGLLRLDDSDRTELVLPLDQLALHPVWSQHVPDTLLLGVRNGLVIAEWRDHRFEIAARFEGLGEVRTIAETADGTLWLGTPNRGYHRVHRAAGAPWTEATVTSYNEQENRLQNHGWVEVFPSPLGPLFASGLGLLRFDERSDAFVPDDRFLIDSQRFGSVRPIFPAANGDLWAQATNDFSVTQRPLGRFRPRADGTYEWRDAPRRLWDVIGLSGAQVLYWESNDADGILWVKGIDSLLRLDLSQLHTRKTNWQVLLKNVQHHGGSESIGDGARLPRLPWSPDPIRINYTSPRFDYGADLRYQTRLLGFDDHWSEPSAREEATFTNLSGGPFTFEVRATDAEGNTSAPARVTFSVTPPLHRSLPAVLAYALAALGAVFGFVRWRLSRAARVQHRLEQLVAQRTAQLEAANNAKSTFLANMSHELRTPLNGVIGYAQVLQKSPDVVARDRERLRIVQTSGEHLLRMINEVLDFSKIEAGKLELRPAPFHLPQLLRDIASALEPRAAQKNLSFILNADPDLPTTLIGDAQKLRQVLDNLLSNAVKFTLTGRVALQVTRARPPRSGLSALDSRLHFAIHDTGVGISEKDQAALFQPFHQPVDARPPEPGTGLGLAIAKRLVELMGGTLELESAPGSGSTFSFSLPLEIVPTEAAPAESTPRIPIGYLGERRRLLVVDDVATNRSVLVELLAPLGFEFREAASGAEALALVPSFAPHLIFLDLRMPGMDGFELAARLRALPTASIQPPKLIAMSASVLSFNRDKALEAGCDDFLPKPFQETDLISKLAMHLRLEWGYGDTSHPFAARDSNSTASADELRSLLELARRGEIRPLREHLTSLRQRHPSDLHLEELESLARDYQMERLREKLSAHF